jgi:hypothetical protein
MLNFGWSNRHTVFFKFIVLFKNKWEAEFPQRVLNLEILSGGIINLQAFSYYQSCYAYKRSFRELKSSLGVGSYVY